jgi:hypothetical protein
MQDYEKIEQREPTQQISEAFDFASAALTVLWKEIVTDLMKHDSVGAVNLYKALKAGARMRAVVNMHGGSDCDIEVTDARGQWQSIYKITTTSASVQ